MRHGHVYCEFACVLHAGLFYVLLFETSGSSRSSRTPAVSDESYLISWYIASVFILLANRYKCIIALNDMNTINRG